MFVLIPEIQDAVFFGHEVEAVLDVMGQAANSDRFEAGLTDHFPGQFLTPGGAQSGATLGQRDSHAMYGEIV